jgi:hypothetical protein
LRRIAPGAIGGGTPADREKISVFLGTVLHRAGSTGTGMTSEVCGEELHRAH